MSWLTTIGGSGRQRIQFNAATVAQFITLYLFWVQPGVDRAGLLMFLEGLFPPYWMMPVVSASLYTLCWIVPASGYFFLYWIQHPYFEQFRLSQSLVF